ncbi:hypothetical protein [Levilactobacillus suantsaiihabitans]|uniref:CHRD domain-containing protein n=1 Tax=Levilactobacillus suantsaiihabitans TaxID=2487722 RepID=A0A4Z0JBP4_9LACO|nr:hypothetical protein [Levilactobacillus suantsaiihabitans]TGD19737.1 hypothetical protein EGT51_02570 [Levilactobacillus suantsaiihabitans]
MKIYQANIVPLNEKAIGTAAHGTALFTINGDSLTINIEMFDTPASLQHWEHFHGFPDGKAAEIATSAQDVNHDGFVDLPETGAVSGTTMVPFNDAPHEMDIPNDEYPVADANGYFAYTKVVPLAALDKKFKETFNDSELELDKRVIYIHGVTDDVALPDTVEGAVGHYSTHVTLPIAVGKIVAL